VSDDPRVMALLASAWVACALVLVVSGALAGRRRSWRLAGRVATAVLYLAAGAAVNLAFLLGGVDYDGFADGSWSAFVRDTWQTLVVPRHELFIGLLVVFEAAVGVLALLGGRATRLAYVAALGFHVALMAFGVGFWLWAVPVAAAFALLLRAEVRASRAAGPPATARPVAGAAAR
jgi:hypothetical protein